MKTLLIIAVGLLLAIPLFKAFEKEVCYSTANAKNVDDKQAIITHCNSL